MGTSATACGTPNQLPGRWAPGAFLCWANLWVPGAPAGPLAAWRALMETTYAFVCTVQGTAARWRATQVLFCSSQENERGRTSSRSSPACHLLPAPGPLHLPPPPPPPAFQLFSISSPSGLNVQKGQASLGLTSSYALSSNLVTGEQTEGRPASSCQRSCRARSAGGWGASAFPLLRGRSAQ